jgi:hypothetical protein
VTTITLYRPVGQAELDLIKESDWKKFPPRLPEQPIFYPVCNKEYAIQITERWNRPLYKSYVLEFKVKTDYLSKHETHIVGSKMHEEYWIPAEELNEFNDNIVDGIHLIFADKG